MLTKSLVALIALAALTGCVSETVGDVVNRETDRDRERAASHANDYQIVTGEYAGSMGNSDVLLSIDKTEVSKDGTNVPQPTLVGNLTFSPRMLIGKSDQRPKFVFPFSDGVFDPPSGDLSFTVERDGRASQVLCKYDGTQALSCKWNVRDYANEFELSRNQAGSLVSGLSRADAFGGAYAGETSDYHIEATFETALETADGTSVPKYTILGSFVFTPHRARGPIDPSSMNVPFTFSDGEYDFGADTLAMTIDGDGARPIVNCKIVDANRLDCKWFSRSGASSAFSFAFRLTKRGT